MERAPGSPSQFNRDHSFPPADSLVSAFAGLATAVTLLGAVVLLTTAGVSGVAADNQTETPELVSGEPVSDVEMQVLFEDDVGVETDSIDADDFILSEGTLDGVSISQSGTDAIVNLSLEAPVASDEVVVALADDSNVSDVEGNTLDASGDRVSVTVSGMDSVPPDLRSLSVEDAHGESGEVVVEFDQMVASLRVDIDGPTEMQLRREDFERTETGTYSYTFEPSESGDYEVQVTQATDDAGNTATFDRTETVEARLDSPDAVAALDAVDSDETTLTFDASQSGEDAVEFIWSMGDGTNVRGERVSHQFGPGFYTVRLEVIDEYGNLGEDHIAIRVPADTESGPATPTDTSETVSVQRESPDSLETAFVTVQSGAAGTPVIVGSDEHEPLLEGETATLQALHLQLDSPATFGLVASVVETDDITVDDDKEILQVFRVSPDIGRTDIVGTHFEFTLEESMLGETGIPPESVELYRETDDGWEPLSTRHHGNGTYEATTDSFSRFSIVAPTDHGTVESAEDDKQGGTGAENESDDGTDSDDTRENIDDDSQFVVQNATVTPETAEAGEDLTVTASVENQGDEDGLFLAGLFVDDERVDTKSVGPVPAGATLEVEFETALEESGDRTVRINGSTAGTVAVDTADGGGLSSLLLTPFIFVYGMLAGLVSLLPLGFVPGGLLRGVFVFLVLPGAVVYGILKGLAIYLGY